MDNSSANSPFQPRSIRRPKFDLIVLQLLIVVAAGVSLLVSHALRVPAIVSDLNAWLGRSSPVFDRAQGRQSQLVFALMCYTAPLALGMFVSLMHVGIRWLNERWQKREDDDDLYRLE